MNLSKMFPSRYVKGEDLQGKDVMINIAHVQPEKMRPNPQSPEIEKFVLYTVEGKKGIVLSKTLATQISRSIGSNETEDWIGKKVTLYPEPMIVAGVQRVAIRARNATDGKQYAIGEVDSGPTLPKPAAD